MPSRKRRAHTQTFCPSTDSQFLSEPSRPFPSSEGHDPDSRWTLTLIHALLYSRVKLCLSSSTATPHDDHHYHIPTHCVPTLCGRNAAHVTRTLVHHCSACACTSHTADACTCAQVRAVRWGRRPARVSTWKDLPTSSQSLHILS